MTFRCHVFTFNHNNRHLQWSRTARSVSTMADLLERRLVTFYGKRHLRFTFLMRKLIAFRHRNLKNLATLDRYSKPSISSLASESFPKWPGRELFDSLQSLLCQKETAQCEITPRKRILFLHRSVRVSHSMVTENE